MSEAIISVLQYHPDVSVSEIAHDLGITEHAAKDRVKRAVAKFGTRTRAGAAYEALRRGLISELRLPTKNS